MPTAHPRLLCVTLALAACTDDDTPPFGYAGDDSEAPALELTLSSPAPGASFAWGDSVPLAGTVQTEAEPEEVALRLDSSLLGELPVGLAVASDYSFGAGLALTEGEHTLTVTATLGALAASAAVTVTQAPNLPPTPPGISLTPQAPASGEPLFAGITRRGEDPEGREVEHRFWWTLDGQAAPEWDGITTIPEGVTHKDEVWEVFAVASDGLVDSEPVSLAVTVLGQGPDITVEIDPQAPSRADTVRCAYSITEPDGAPITAQSARWLLNGVEVGSADTPLSGGLSRGDELSCRVSATSSQTVTAQDTVTVINLPPSVSGVVLTGTPATEAATLGCAVSASDPDGDSLSTELSWWVDGVEVSSDLTLDGASFDAGQEVLCRARVWDGAEWSAAVDSAAEPVGNSAPTPAVLALDPDPAPVGVELRCEELSPASDLDPADSLLSTWTWAVNGAVVASGTPSLSTWGLSAGDGVACTQEVSDGVASASASVSLVLGSRLEGALSPSGADLTLAGSSSKAAFGAALLPVDDLDGDGLGELLVAASGYDSGRGAVHLFTGAELIGGAARDTDAAAWWVGAASADALGDLQGLGVLPDVDGDGVVELLLAAPTATVQAAEDGAVYVLSSSGRAAWTAGAAVSADADLVVRGAASKDRLGSALAGADVDGDGAGDLLVGLPYDDEAGSNSGSVAVFLLGGALPPALSDADADYTLTADETLDHLGLSGLENLGDLDGDGSPELLLGAPDMDSRHADDAGVAFLVSASALADGAASALASARIEGLATDDDLGLSGVGLGDLDGDGWGELAVGARFGDVVATDGGGVYFWFGVPSGVVSAAAADASWGSGAANDRLGWGLGAGDIDGDGLLDLSVGAYTQPAGGRTEAGAAALLPGAGYTSWGTGGLIWSEALATVGGAATRSYLGRDPVVLGDLDGDGYGEWAVGAQGQNQGTTTRAGAVYLWWGP